MKRLSHANYTCRILTIASAPHHISPKLHLQAQNPNQKFQPNIWGWSLTHIFKIQECIVVFKSPKPQNSWRKTVCYLHPRNGLRFLRIYLLGPGSQLASPEFGPAPSLRPSLAWAKTWLGPGPGLIEAWVSTGESNIVSYFPVGLWTV